MSRDYKPSSPRTGNRRQGNPFITGLLLGVLLGVVLSVAVAFMVKGGDSVFIAKAPPAAKQENAAADTSALPQDESTDKPRFDFYTILPGSESQVTEQEIKQKAAQDTPVAANENYYLQAGAFQSVQEADNMKARLALLGMEAVVQTATIPDKGTWHRVRVGPFSELSQINRTRSELARNGFKADLIKVNAE